MLSAGDFLSQIRFRLVAPRTRPFRGYRRLNTWLKSHDIDMEWMLTRLPDQSLGDSLRDLARVPRMSTLAIGALVNHAVSAMSPSECFVNVGVWHGFTLLSGMLGNSNKRCVGVDNFSEFGGPKDQFMERFVQFKSSKHMFHEMDYLEYFEKEHKGPIGVYIYDGAHDYENQLRGLMAAEPFLSKNCVVLVDDTNWEEPRAATLDFIAGSSSSYSVVVDQRTACSWHPTFWNGIMVVQKDG